MSFLPKKETDILSLINAGYSVTYSDTEDYFMYPFDMEMHDCIKECIQKDGIVYAPNGEPAVKYFDKKSGEIVAAVWHNPQGQLHRENAPAFVCERTEDTGGWANYAMLGYFENGELHNESGAALISEDTKAGKTIRSVEGHYLHGNLMKYRRLDGEGNIVPEFSYPENLDAEDLKPTN